MSSIPEYWEEMKEGASHYEKSEWLDAICHWTIAICKEPDNATARYLIAKAAQKYATTSECAEKGTANPEIWIGIANDQLRLAWEKSPEPLFLKEYLRNDETLKILRQYLALEHEGKDLESGKAIKFMQSCVKKLN